MVHSSLGGGLLPRLVLWVGSAEIILDALLHIEDFAFEVVVPQHWGCDHGEEHCVFEPTQVFERVGDGHCRGWVGSTKYYTSELEWRSLRVG